MRKAFGPWEPDSAGVDMRDNFGRAIMATASGVYPSKTGYVPVPSLQDFATFQLPATCVGAFVGVTSAGGHVFFAGTATKLYRFDPALGWIDYTRTVGGNYNVPSGEYWSATQFGSRVIFVNINDDPQYIDIDTGAVNFALLGGTPPKSRYVAVVGEFLVLASQSLAPNKITNSAINDSTGWTVGTNFCDEQTFVDGEAITGLAGGEHGWVTQVHAIRQMIFQPGYDQAFRFERVEREHGASAGFSLAAVKDTIFFLSDDGFYSFRDALVPIGHQRVNQWFRDNTDTARFFSVLAFTDPFAPRVYWAAYSSASSTTLDIVLCYDWSLDQFSYLSQAAQFWSRQVTAGTTLEALNAYGDIDSGAIPYPFDSPVWAGGRPIIAAITTAGRLAFLNGGTPMTATLLTAPMQLMPGGRSFVDTVEPIGVFNGAAVTMRIGKRERTQASVSYTGSLSPSSRSGLIRGRRSGRIHEFEQTITQSSGTLWKHTEAIDINVSQDGTQ